MAGPPVREELGAEAAAQARLDPPGSILARFLKFGLLAWGGPAAQIAMIERECVAEERWVSRETFRKTLAVYQVLPGPEAHELCVYFGRLRGGRLGALLAGLGFMLPGFLAMLGLSILYVEADLADNLDDLFYGLKAAVGAIVARALVRLSRTFVTDLPLAAIAVAAFVVSLLAPTGFVLVLAGAGLAYELWSNGATWARRVNSVAVAPAAALALVALAGAGAGASAGAGGADVFWEGLRTGLLTFGGAFTAVPFLQEAAVDGHGWIDRDEFVDGLAIASVLPAPLIVFSTFVGYLAGGLGGGLLMTVGIFLPAFALPIFLHRPLVRLADDERVRALLLGVAAGAIGVIAAVTVGLVEAGVVDVPTAAIAVAAFLALNRWHGKLTVLYVVLGCGLVGAALRLLGA